MVNLKYKQNIVYKDHYLEVILLTINYFLNGDESFATPKEGYVI